MFKIFDRAVMTTDKTHLTGQERFFELNQMIVSKTDL